MSALTIPRRDFLLVGSAAAAGLALARPNGAMGSEASASRLRIETFDYQGVKLRPSRWQRQYKSARDFYIGVADDDILHGWRAAAGLPAPGKALGGWCNANSNTVFGQWLQGLSRMSHADGDTAVRDKAIALFTQSAKTVGPDGNCRMGHYPLEKLVGGLVDLKQYAGHDPALEMLERVVDYASKNLDRTRTPATPRPPANHSGRPLEWYTVGENLYRAFQLTGNVKYKDFADVWQYHAYWDKFLETSGPPDAYGVHAYSHVNTWSSCAMAYAVTGDATYLQRLKNAYDFLQNTQCYATGGYGPVERIMPTNGNLGRALETQQNSCEAPCCSWAAFKMARYLMTFTGEARYGDWIERLLYNGIGAALPITENGKNFYYSDYRVAGGAKTYARSTYTCCSGTYLQAVTEYQNLIYFKDADSLFVNLYLPSEVAWKHRDGDVKLTQETAYPEAESITFTLSLGAKARFAVKFRVPGWAHSVSAKLNGEAVNIQTAAGTWAAIDREWNNGDKVELQIPLPLRYEPVDKWHPDRVALVRGPTVLVQDAAVHEPIYALPANDEELNKLLVPDGVGGQFNLRLTGSNNTGAGRFAPPAVAQAGAKFMPYYAIPEVNFYRMYFDRKDHPVVLW
jgi:uncharacterized protein